MYPGEPGRYTRGRVDPGEQTTGTRDEHYNLISVLYHALHGADTCSLYVMDAEAAGREDLAAFFREAQAAQVGLAERAKELMGIGSVAPGAGGVPPGTAPPETEIPPERMVGPEAPPEDASPGASMPEEDLLPPGDVAPRPPSSARGVPPDVPPPREAPGERNT